MKVLFVSEDVAKHLAYRVANFVPRVLCMPCTVAWAKTNQEVTQYIQGADVILLNRCMHTWWLTDDSPVYKTPIPTARFYLDVWKIPGLKEKVKKNPEFRTIHGTRYADFFRKYDMRISPCKELFEKSCPGWISSMFWSPHCIDVQNFDVPKDIDVLFWGNPARRYRIRNEMRRLLESHVSGKPKRIDKLLTMYRLVLNGRKYRFALLGYNKRRPYCGAKLYELISRAKVCCTGPRLEERGVPVGKFFENAACGTVSLTTDFTDREALGFEHGKNIWISKLDLSCFLNDLTYLLEHPNLIDKMSKNAKELIRTRHTPEIRGRELYEFFRERTGVV
jgi:glycosyltransferase involved in cell wall biosynthesis